MRVGSSQTSPSSSLFFLSEFLLIILAKTSPTMLLVFETALTSKFEETSSPFWTSSSFLASSSFCASSPFWSSPFWTSSPFCVSPDASPLDGLTSTINDPSFFDASSLFSPASPAGFSAETLSGIPSPSANAFIGMRFTHNNKTRNNATTLLALFIRTLSVSRLLCSQCKISIRILNFTKQLPDKSRKRGKLRSKMTTVHDIFTKNDKKTVVSVRKDRYDSCSI